MKYAVKSVYINMEAAVQDLNVVLAASSNKENTVMEQVKIMQTDGEALQIALSGDIDLGNAEAFFAEVMQAYQENPKDIAFDCEQLSFIDSTTLGTFVKILKTVKVNGHTVRLFALQPKIKKLFVICSLNTIMEIA